MLLTWPGDSSVAFAPEGLGLAVRSDHFFFSLHEANLYPGKIDFFSISFNFFLSA